MRGVQASLPGFVGVRLNAEEAENLVFMVADHLAPARSSAVREDFNFLAISGGAAGGAFGAGVLVGLSQAGTRPTFSIVTGVSTGALMAPFAFLGSAWDHRLKAAYTGGLAAQAISLRRLAPAFGAGLFRADALESLIDPFIDAELVAAVAREHALGRRLLVTTTDLDSQKTCIWDMGAIASRGGDDAVKLFRDILVASASLPGLFPPRRFPCEADGVAYEEMHVDGGVSTPLFIMPEALLRWKRRGGHLHGGRIYVIINTVLEHAPRTTSTNLAAILLRSFDTMLRFSYRNALSSIANFCAANDLPLSVTAIQDDPDNGHMLSFDTADMLRGFDAGVKHATGGALWSTPTPGPPIG
ncbi:patatin-like phospholipase family protein [Phenylobacterium sp.]|uniref:patatin-like phospholipase family protein n=1 Tax=Phenylobacterium sp. TaxID=1871053 RepID=UPI0027363D34|nr:patatin-like phospholipase family protein [Phenylobacterium sp.]MDP3592649.1 patatin-like phospholipase family protein [Phenylobacterium sp.]